MVRGHALWLLLVAQTLWIVWGQSVPKSPCPNMFWYEMDSSGNWHGRMSVPAPPPSNSWRTIVELNIDAVLSTQNVGAVKLMENENEVWRRINTGNNWPVQFYVSFPLSWPLPEVRSITSNGNYICIGNMSRSFLTKVTLEYFMYPLGGVTDQRRNQNGNQRPVGMNNYQYVVHNTNNYGSYTAKPPTDVSARGLGFNDDSVERLHDDVFPFKGGNEQISKNNTAVPPYESCPGVFHYQQSSSGEWYGKISVLNPYPILAIHIVVDIYAAAEVPMITEGSLQPANNLNEEWKRIQRGEKFFIQYNLQFPVFKTHATITPTLPVVKSVIVNGNVLCTGKVPSYSLLVTLSYQHSIFSERCTSSSLKCPYNIAPSAIINPVPSDYITTPPSNQVNQIYTATQQINTPPPPTHEPTPQAYNPSSPTYESASPKDTLTSTYAPTSQTYVPSPLPFQSTSEVYETSSPKHETTTQVYKSSTNKYQPTPHIYTPSTTTFRYTPPTFRPSPPRYQPPQTEEPWVTPKDTDPHISQTTESRKKVQCGTLEVENNLLVAHGEETIPGQWPWHAALYLYMKRDIKFRCGGSYVGTRTVITAAHCVIMKGEMQRAEDIIIYLGKHNLRDINEPGFQSKDVIKIAVHPTYNGTYAFGDIAVLILAQAVEITKVVRPVCLWGHDDSNPADIINQEGLVVGWGLDERDEPTETLMMVKMPVVSQQTCIWSEPNYYSMFTSNGTFCAGFRNGSSVCNGDSGGGMVFPRQQSDGTHVWVLRGIVSHSRPRTGYNNYCDTKSYIVFTDVFQYLDWINDIII